MMISTPSPDRPDARSFSTRTIVQLALLVAVGLVLFVFESFIPRPLPWLRLGLANIATLLALYLFGVREAFMVAIARAILGSLSFGGLFTPSFVFSFVGGVASTAAMAIFFRYLKNVFSVIGISLWGALVHNMVQLVLAMTLFVRRGELISLLPLFLCMTVVSGFSTGLIVYLLLGRIQRQVQRVEV